MLDEEPLREYPTSKELFIYFIVFIYLVILQASCVLWSKWIRIRISNGQEATDWQFTSAAAFKQIHLVSAHDSNKEYQNMLSRKVFFYSTLLPQIF